MNIIPSGLFLLGVIFLIIGWRWQSSRSEEDVVVLKGLAYLKGEIVRVQDHVYVLEDEIIKTKQLYNGILENQTKDHENLDHEKKEHMDVVPIKLVPQQLEPIKLNHQEIGLIEQERIKIEQKEKVELNKLDYNEIEHMQKAKLYSISSQEQREQSSKASKRVLEEKTESMQQELDNNLHADYHISGKFREVLELAAQGQPIPDISQRLFISQDAVRMVLSMRSKGGAR